MKSYVLWEKKKKNERASKDTQHTYVEANCLLKGYEYYKY